MDYSRSLAHWRAELADTNEYLAKIEKAIANYQAIRDELLAQRDQALAGIEVAECALGLPESVWEQPIDLEISGFAMDRSGVKEVD